MNSQGDFTIDEVTAYVKSWKEELEIRQKEIYSKYLSGAMGGVLMIVVTIGLSLDKLAKLGWFERTLLGAALFFLMLAVGNILNCTTFVTNARLELALVERELILGGSAPVPRDRMEELNKRLNIARDNAHKFFPYTYMCTLIAVLLGIVGFFTLLARV